MRQSLSKVLILAAAVALVPASANAQLPTAGSPSCFDALYYPGFSMNFDWCWGSFNGNDEHYKSDILTALATWDPGTWTALGSSDDAVSPFYSAPETVAGYITFPPIIGPFAISIKAGPRWSLFWWENSGGGAVGSVPFNTAGVSDTGEGFNASSHVNLYTSGNVVPEPSTVILLGTGLLGLFGVEYRRRKKKA